MNPPYGPRTLLVSQILPALLAMLDSDPINESRDWAVEEAIRLADLTLDKMSRAPYTDSAT